MKKEELEIELTNLTIELNKLESQALLEYETTQFLGKEADKLLLKTKDESISFEERESLHLQIDALQAKMESESRSIERGMNKLKEVSKRLAYFQSLTIEE